MTARTSPGFELITDLHRSDAHVRARLQPFKHKRETACGTLTLMNKRARARDQVMDGVV